MPPPTSLSASSRARSWLAPITESPPDFPPPGRSRSPHSPLGRISFLSLQRALHHRPRTPSSSSSEDTSASASPAQSRARATATSNIVVAHDAYVDEHQVTESPAPRNSGTFGRVDMDYEDRTPGEVGPQLCLDLSPTTELASSPSSLSPAVESGVDLISPGDEASRRSGTFGPLQALHDLQAPRVTTTVALASPSSSQAYSPVAETNLMSLERGLSPLASLLDVCASEEFRPPLKPSPSHSSLFYTPVGSSVSLDFRGTSPPEKLLLPSDGQSALDEGWLASGQSEERGASSGGEGTHKTGSMGRRGSASTEDVSPKAQTTNLPGIQGVGPRFSIKDLQPHLSASHAALLAFAEALSEEASTLERSSARLKRIRQSLDGELEGLIGLTPLLAVIDDEPLTPPRAEHSSAGHAPGSSDDQDGPRLSAELLESLRRSATSLVSQASPPPPKERTPCASAELPARSAPRLPPFPAARAPGAPLKMPQTPRRWLGASAQGTMLSSRTSLPFTLATSHATSNTGPPFKRQKRKSWIKRIFS